MDYDFERTLAEKVVFWCNLFVTLSQPRRPLTKISSTARAVL